MIRFYRGILVAGGIAVAASAVPVRAQDNFDAGKTPAQLYAADCAICHKTPQGLAKGGGVFGLAGFLREHYTASREAAAAIAAYVQAVDTGPPPVAKKPQTNAPQRATTRANRVRPSRGRPSPNRSNPASRRPPPPNPVRQSQQTVSLARASQVRPSQARPKAAPRLATPRPPSRRRSSQSRLNRKQMPQSRRQRMSSRKRNRTRRSDLVLVLSLPRRLRRLGFRIPGQGRSRFLGFGLTLFALAYGLCFGIEQRRGCRCGNSCFFFCVGAAHGNVLAAGDAFGFVGATGDDDSDGRLYFRMQRQRNLVLADGLDRCIEHDMRARDLSLVAVEQRGNIACRYRAVQLAAFGSLAQHGDSLAVEFGRHLFGASLHFQIARLQLGLHSFEARLVFGGGTQRLAARQQEVTSKAVLDAHHIAHLTELADTFE